MHRFAVISAILVVLLLSFAFLSISAANAQGQYCVTAQIPVTNPSGNSIRVYARIGDWFQVPASMQVYAIGPTVTLLPGGSATASVAVLLSDSQVSNAWWGLIALDSPYPTIDFSGVVFNTNAPLSSCTGGGGAATIGDGRVNGTDLAAPLAAYCTGSGLAIWDIDGGGAGTFAFAVTAEQIEAALGDAETSGQNVLVAEGLGNSLYALSSSELVLVGPEVKEPGKLYQRILAADVCG